MHGRQQDTVFGVACRTGDDLHAAARSDDAAAVRACIAKGSCDINTRAQPDLWTPLIRAAHEGHGARGDDALTTRAFTHRLKHRSTA